MSEKDNIMYSPFYSRENMSLLQQSYRELPIIKAKIDLFDQKSREKLGALIIERGYKVGMINLSNLCEYKLDYDQALSDIISDLAKDNDVLCLHCHYNQGRKYHINKADEIKRKQPQEETAEEKRIRLLKKYSTPLVRKGAFVRF